MSDQKIKTAAAKAPLGLVPQAALVGPARVFGYGAKKYQAGNYYQADLSDGAGQRYISAALRHLSEMQLPNGLHTPESLATLDTESGLPHIDHVLCGLLMLRTIMVKGGALPVDPGVGNEPPVHTVDTALADMRDRSVSADDRLRVVGELVQLAFPTYAPQEPHNPGPRCSCRECGWYRAGSES